MICGAWRIALAEHTKAEKEENKPKMVLWEARSRNLEALLKGYWMTV